jgi:hypothetical protein
VKERPSRIRRVVRLVKRLCVGLKGLAKKNRV